MRQSPSLSGLDHLVLTVRDVEKTCAFYATVLGMQVQEFSVADGSTRKALKFGAQKINLHQAGAEFDPKAAHPTPGSADLCFLSETPIAEWTNHLADLSVQIAEGPVQRSGASFAIVSIYFRDPDQNLIEIGTRLATDL
ncbi:MAG: VOC family protein [Ascidiaceihabitans sp.]|nr:VOC family protein [Ascidiaceihabitans sp.]